MLYGGAAGGAAATAMTLVDIERELTTHEPPMCARHAHKSSCDFFMALGGATASPVEGYYPDFFASALVSA